MFSQVSCKAHGTEVSQDDPKHCYFRASTLSRLIVRIWLPYRIFHKLRIAELDPVKARHLLMPVEQDWAKVIIYQQLGTRPVC